MARLEQWLVDALDELQELGTTRVATVEQAERLAYVAMRRIRRTGRDWPVWGVMGGLPCETIDILADHRFALSPVRVRLATHEQLVRERAEAFARLGLPYDAEADLRQRRERGLM